MRYKAKVVTTTIHWLTVHEDTPEAAHARVETRCKGNSMYMELEPDGETVEVVEVVEWPGPLFEKGSHARFVEEHQ